MAFPVRGIRLEDRRLTLLMDIEDDDTTKVVDENNKIGLKFDHTPANRALEAQKAWVEPSHRHIHQDYWPWNRIVYALQSTVKGPGLFIPVRQVIQPNTQD